MYPVATGLNPFGFTAQRTIGYGRQTAYPWTWFHTGESWKYYISSTNKWVSN